jgi:hypothetical protein
MQHRYSTHLLAAIGLLCSLTANAQQTGPAPSGQRVTIQGQKRPSSWFKAESEHFVVYADTSRESAALMLQNMERLDYLLRAYTKPLFKGKPNAARLTLYYHRRKSDLEQHVGQSSANVVGLYNSCSAGVQGVGVELTPLVEIDDAHLSRAADNDTQVSLFEAYARHFLYRHTDVRAPKSFIEGFAQYFAAVRFSDDQIVVGSAPAAIAQYLDFIGNGRQYSLTYADVLDGNDSKSINYAGPTGVELEFKARSWLLTHFMLSSEANRTRMVRYLNLANGGVGASQAFETAFAVKPAELDRLLWRYRLSAAKVLQLDAPSLPTAHIDFTALPDSVTDYVAMDATLKSCPARATGEAVLRKMNANPDGTPNHPLARMALSRAQVDWGDPKDAIPYLTTLVGAGKANPEARELLGLAYLHLARRQQGATRTRTLETARHHLLDAVNADPASATAAYGLLRAELATGEPPSTTAMTAAELAWDNGREVDEYARSAALLYAYAGNAAKSRAALNVLINDGRVPAMAAWARQWQARLLAGVDSADVLAELRRVPAAGGAIKEWTVAGDISMQAVTRAAGVADWHDYVQAQRSLVDQSHIEEVRDMKRKEEGAMDGMLFIP